MTTLSSLRSGIKSIQAGTITITSTNASNTATISSVNTAKSFVLHNGQGTNVTDLRDSLGRVQLTNATTVTLTRTGSGGIATLIVAYTVVEFN